MKIENGLRCINLFQSRNVVTTNIFVAKDFPMGGLVENTVQYVTQQGANKNSQQEEEVEWAVHLDETVKREFVKEETIHFRNDFAEGDI